MKKIIILNKNDNVAVALEDIMEKEKVLIFNKNIKLLEKIAFEHKFALEDIKKGEKVLKYGIPIGVAYKDIKKGEHVHLHNLRTLQTNSEVDDKKEWSNRIA